MRGYIKKHKGLIILLYIAMFIILVIMLRYQFRHYLFAAIIMTVLLLALFYPAVFGLIGNFFYAVSNYKSAEKYLQKAVAANTSQPTVYLNYAILLMKAGRSEQALKYLQTARATNRKIPTDQNIGLSIAGCYLLLRRNAEAIEVLEELRENYDNLSNYAISVISYAYIRNNRYDDALALMSGMNEAEMTASEWETLGLVYFKTEQYGEAQRSFLKALSLNDSLIESNFYLAEIYSKANDKEKAAVYYAKAATSQPSAFGGVQPEEARKKLDEFTISNK